MDELISLIKDLIKLIPMDHLEAPVREVIQSSLVSRAGSAVKGLVDHVASVARPYLAPTAGAPVDEDLPPAPDHWSREAPPDDTTLATAAPPPPPPAADQVDMEKGLAALAPAPGEAGLPSTTIAEQLAYAQRLAQSGAPDPAPTSGGQAPS